MPLNFGNTWVQDVRLRTIGVITWVFQLRADQPFILRDGSPNSPSFLLFVQYLHNGDLLSTRD